ncbi:GNAT family N-acetyltransferase [Planctomicrobium sp. SH664]|uniref:GNAT family N-acetyltransferase n=1 Tax=Planctomicrobium sp. SH664 TaxID=3448125 RepID=UPI003F5AF51F
MAPYRMELLSDDHDRTGFDCGVAPLNDYLLRQVGQDTRRRVTTCFVAVETASDRLAGYYTLSAGSVVLDDLPEKTAKKLPRYPTVPIVRIGRLAVDQRDQGQQLGSALLFDALKRSISAEIAAFAAVVDAKDDHAKRFYERFGFQSLNAKPRVLFLPLSDAIKKLALQ